MRGVNPATGLVLYYRAPELKGAEVLTLEITDGEGRSIRTFRSTKDTTFVPQRDAYELALGPDASSYLFGDPGLVRLLASGAFDPTYVHRLSGLSVGRDGVFEILTKLGFSLEGKGAVVRVQPPSWRRDVEGPADLVEEVARIAGYGALPSTPLPSAPVAPQGVLRPLEVRVRRAHLYTAVKELAPDGRISCSQAHDFAHLHSIDLGKMRLLLDACCIRLKGCQLGCF